MSPEKVPSRLLANNHLSGAVQPSTHTCVTVLELNLTTRFRPVADERGVLTSYHSRVDTVTLLM